MELTDLAWLAGIIEGEGSITAHIRKKTPKQNGVGYYGGIAVQVSISNTEYDLIDYAHKIIVKVLGEDLAKIHLNKRKTATGRNAYRMCLQGFNRVKILLEAILPYMHCESKRRQAELTIEICKRTPFSRMSDQDVENISNIQFLHGHHNLTVETIRRRVLNRKTQDIVRTSMKMEEVIRNDNPPLTVFKQ